MILLAATSFALYLGQQEILAARKKSAKSGFPTGIPYAVRQQLVSCYGFKTKNRGLEIPILRGTRLSIPLTKHTLDAISQPGVKVRSFVLTQKRLSLCIARDTPMIECASAVGVDRNLRNLTIGNYDQTRHYNLSKCVRIAKTTVRIVASFTRNNDRIRTGLASTYGQWRTSRTGHLLHNATKQLSPWQSNGEQQLFSRTSRTSDPSTGRVTVRVESIAVE